MLPIRVPLFLIVVVTLTVPLVAAAERVPIQVIKVKVRAAGHPRLNEWDGGGRKRAGRSVVKFTGSRDVAAKISNAVAAQAIAHGFKLGYSQNGFTGTHKIVIDTPRVLDGQRTNKLLHQLTTTLVDTLRSYGPPSATP